MNWKVRDELQLSNRVILEFNIIRVMKHLKLALDGFKNQRESVMLATCVVIPLLLIVLLDAVQHTEVVLRCLVSLYLSLALSYQTTHNF